MKSSIEKTKLSPVDVELSVTGFKDVFTDESRQNGGTAYTMKLKRKHPRAKIIGDDIYVRRPGATLRFTVESSNGDKETYYPVGIAFVREGDHPSDELRLGMGSFPKLRTRTDGQTLTIVHRCGTETGRVRHKFSVVIQRGSDGRIGIIDPGITSDDDH